ncbi:Quaternary ammonium compound-resistance protein SugE [Fundidesulfovibrio magnetotacticus]|uniref:Guanidinium exporter n=1 Tax=Fundidesulfovibrio magnetotacticus TaxID=2730080 RepID=A0A6V8LN43_9BACT|nr:multidrug efflux SMR transporter [Fundidesulfovibrio magnetotacticus]GFK94073.1 Quaternary ammonium compound-resistance protein SugE [Fundidesulfovibrio magnetotacticus]
MRTAWFWLVVAGLFEVGWPVGLKMAQTPGKVALGVALAVACMGLSGWLLWLAQKSIPMGTAYAVWTGIGAAGTFLVGVAFHGDPAGLARVAGVGLIVAGVALLKLAS